MAGVNRGLEGLACDVFNQLVHIARKMGDPILERAVDFVLQREAGFGRYLLARE